MVRSLSDFALTLANRSRRCGLAMKSSTSVVSSARSRDPAASASTSASRSRLTRLALWRSLARFTSAWVASPSRSTTRTNLHMPAWGVSGENASSPFISCEMTVCRVITASLSGFSMSKNGP